MAKAPPRAPYRAFSMADSIEVVGTRSATAGDLYHLLLSAPWWVDLAVITGLFLVSNVLFAGGYLLVGGVANARPGSFADAFFFSVQTMGTIGYGQMFPQSTAASSLMTAEALISIVQVALATGLVFAKFSVPRARVIFSDRAVISQFDGVPTLMFRVANERKNHVVEATVRVAIVREEKSQEGISLYRMRDLQLVRERSPAFARTWLVMHALTPDSPLHGQTAASMAANETQILVTLTGVDGTSAQAIHARAAYVDEEILFGKRFRDMLLELPDGRVRLDFGRFHDVLDADAPVEA